MHFESYADLTGRPHIVVDGSAQDGTVLTLSHWPHSGTPETLADDLSAEIAFNYLDHPELHVDVEAVTNNHFDEDGSIAAFVLTNPEFALGQRALLCDIAAAGDFGTYQWRDAAHIAFTLSAWSDPDTSPFEQTIFDLPYPQLCGHLYEETLERLPELIEFPGRFNKFWENEDAFLQESEKAIASGEIVVEEQPDIDLAIVRVPENLQRPHEMAIHNLTPRFRILYVQGQDYEFHYRYESWVQYQSRRPMPRVDLVVLTAELNAIETSGGTWIFDGVSDTNPSLRLTKQEESSIPPDTFLEMLSNALATGASAWTRTINYSYSTAFSISILAAFLAGKIAANIPKSIAANITTTS